MRDMPLGGPVFLFCNFCFKGPTRNRTKIPGHSPQAQAGLSASGPPEARALVRPYHEGKAAGGVLQY